MVLHNSWWWLLLKGHFSICLQLMVGVEFFEKGKTPLKKHERGLFKFLAMLKILLLFFFSGIQRGFGPWTKACACGRENASRNGDLSAAC